MVKEFVEVSRGYTGTGPESDIGLTIFNTGEYSETHVCTTLTIEESKALRDQLDKLINLK